MWHSIQPQRFSPRLRAGLCGGVLAFFANAAQADEHTVITSNTSSIAVPLGSLSLTDTVVQAGDLEINRFTMHRLRRPIFHQRGTLLLLPSLGNNFGQYLYGDGGNTAQSFAAVFARLGYDVWAYSPRTTGISAGACGGGMNCNEALNWSLQTIVDDVNYIRACIEVAAPGTDPVIGGLSLGAISALAVVNQAPQDYAGLLAWEGSLVTDDPAIQAHALGFYAQFDAMINAGIAVDDQSLPFVKLVAQLAQIAPNDPFAIPVPGFPPGLTNQQALLLILTTPNPIAPSPRPGFITAAGDFLSGQLFYSNITRLSQNITLFNDVTANGVARDLYGSLAGVVTHYSNNLTNFTAPVMVIKAGQGFGSIMDELPGKLGSTSVTFLQQNNFAHVDHLGSPLHWLLLEAPIAAWLQTTVFP